jgi:hypothetical protein
MVCKEVVSVAELISNVDKDSGDGSIPPVCLGMDVHLSQEAGKAF